MGERLQSTNSTMVMAGTSGIAAVVSLPTTTVASISASATARALSARGASVSGVPRRAGESIRATKSSGRKRQKCGALLGSLGLEVDTKQVATVAGTALSALSVTLYAPVAVRVVREKSADGLTQSTWWSKTAGFLVFLIYAQRNHYPIAQWGDTAVLTLESAVVLSLVAWYQGKEGDEEPGSFDLNFFGGIGALGVLGLLGTTVATEPMLAVAQVGAILSQKGALVPQILLNNERKGCDYSPVTASLALAGSAVKVFTTLELANGDPLLLVSFSSGMALNAALLGQALWFGVVQDDKNLREIFSEDFRANA